MLIGVPGSIHIFGSHSERFFLPPDSFRAGFAYPVAFAGTGVDPENESFGVVSIVTIPESSLLGNGKSEKITRNIGRVEPVYRKLVLLIVDAKPVFIISLDGSDCITDVDKTNSLCMGLSAAG